jgi:hypothetical protein
MQSFQSEYTNEKTKPKRQLQLISIICAALIILGTLSLTISIIYESQIFAFIGLGLFFWGAVLLFIQPEKYIKKVLLDAAILPPLETIDKIIKEMDYKGKAIYLPPKYFTNPETIKTYIPKEQEKTAPKPSLILEQENNVFLKNNKGILVTPPGAQLVKLFEKRLGTNFAHTDIYYVKRNLPKLFIEDLEIAENLEIDMKLTDELTLGIVKFKITNSIFNNNQNKDRNLSEIYSIIGNPISSAIASTLAKSTGKPVTIKDVNSSKDGKIVEITYEIEKIGYVEKTKPILKQPIKVPSKPLSTKIPALILFTLGILILAWIFHLTWVDITFHEKSLDIILFGARTYEPIGLGIGMTVINYYIIGLALLISGIITFIVKRGSD